MFSVEDSFIYGFSNIGFKIFRALCNVVNYINGLYMNSAAGTSSSVAGAIPLMPIKLNSSMIFYKLMVEGEVEVVVTDFCVRQPRDLVKKTRKGRPKGHISWIKVEQRSCELAIDDSKIPGTSLHRATCSTGPCVAISKPIEEAKTIYRILCQCDHPNVLKPIGVWKNPSDDASAYLVLEEVEASLGSKDREFMFSVEDSFIYGFSNIGFKIFRALCNVVNYINGLYMNSAAGTSSSVAGAIPLMPIKLNSSMIFYKLMVEGEVEVVVTDFCVRQPRDLVKKTRKGRPKEVTIEDVQQFNWRAVGLCLKKMYGPEGNVNEELKDLAAYLEGSKPEEGPVTYDGILWHPGAWEANIKTQFIREIFWLIDKERDKLKTKKLIETEKGKSLIKIKRMSRPKIH
uniref:Protein kinase domain-containing protein n=2 Tax=Oryza meridionalis TaxID=40149 RepID=A0A0E0F657_9ORYZ